MSAFEAKADMKPLGRHFGSGPKTDTAGPERRQPSIRVKRAGVEAPPNPPFDATEEKVPESLSIYLNSYVAVSVKLVHSRALLLGLDAVIGR